MKTVLKIMLGIILGFTVLIVGCVALLAGGVDQAQKDSDKTAITVQQYGSVKTGSSTRKQIEANFGAPQTSNEVQTEGVDGIPKSDFSQSCIYYNRKGKLASLFQFCFDGDGKLRSKVELLRSNPSTRAIRPTGPFPPAASARRRPGRSTSR